MRDMTKGSPMRHLITYAVPLVLGTWFQMGYNAVDAIIVGRFLGKQALAAVGIASPVMNLVILSISGVSIGAGVLMSEFFGAGDRGNLKKQFSTTVLSGGVISLLVTLLGLIFTGGIITLLSVPDEIIQITTLYLRLTFLGAPFTFLYNILSSMLKSVGDSKTPLRFLMITSTMNGILDLVLIGYFGFGIACSAMTTVLSQFMSAMMAIVYLAKRYTELWPGSGEWVIDKELLKKTISYGGITALQQSIQPICKILIQGQVNLLGVNVIAAFNAVSKIDAFAFVPEQGIAQAITTYVAQNRGAEKKNRINHGFACGILLELCYWVLIGSITLCFKKPIVSLFISGADSDAIITIGAEYLALMAFFYIFPGLTNGVQGYFRGMGMFKTTVLGTITQAGMRTVMTYILAPAMGIKGIAIGCAVGWSLMLLVQGPILIKNIRNQV